MKNKKHIFSVSGRGHFPIDMLRYDCCYPASQEDVRQMSFSHGDFANGNTHSVTLIGDYLPTIARWRSFGWKVIKNTTMFVA